MLIDSKNKKSEFKQVCQVSSKLLEISDNDEDQVKIEDQGNVVFHESHKTISDNMDSDDKRDSFKQRHLFYIQNLHGEEQELTNSDDNDYLNFNKHEKKPDAKDELRMLLCSSHQTLSYNSSYEKIKIHRNGKCYKSMF